MSNPDKQIPGVGLWYSPSVVELHGSIYVFHNDTSNNGTLRYVVYKDGNWSEDHVVPNTWLSDSPAAIVYNEKIYVFHQSGGIPHGGVSELLYYNVMSADGTWAGDTPVKGVRLVNSPSVVKVGGSLRIFYQGFKDNGLWTLNLIKEVSKEEASVREDQFLPHLPAMRHTLQINSLISIHIQVES